MDSDGSGVKLRQLQMLRQVVRSGSMRLAARALHVSQPAISQNIKQLEEAIEFTLFRRDSGRLVATEKALELLRTVDAVFVGLDRIEKSIAALKGNESRVIRIAAPGVFSLRVVPRAVKTIREIYPSCSIQLKSGGYSEVADHVRTGRADFGISRLPLDERFFEWTPVGMARNVCLFPPDHRFLSKQIITPEDLIGEALIDIEPQFSAHQMNVNALRYMGAEPDIAVEYDANGHDAGFVAAGVGISVTNEIVAREYNCFGLEFRLFEPGAVYHYVVFWQKARPLSEGVRRAVELVVVAFSTPESIA